MTKSAYTTRVIRSSELAAKGSIIELTLANDLLNQLGGIVFLFKKKRSGGWSGNMFRNGTSTVLVVPKEVVVSDYFDNKVLPSDNERLIFNEIITLDGVTGFTPFSEKDGAPRHHSVSITRDGKEYAILVGSNAVDRKMASAAVSKNFANLFSIDNYEPILIQGRFYGGAFNKLLEDKSVETIGESLTTVIAAIMEVRSKVGHFYMGAEYCGPNGTDFKAKAAKIVTIDELFSFSIFVQETPVSLMMVAERLLSNSRMKLLKKSNSNS